MSPDKFLRSVDWPPGAPLPRKTLADGASSHVSSVYIGQKQRQLRYWRGYFTLSRTRSGRPAPGNGSAPAGEVMKWGLRRLESKKVFDPPPHEQTAALDRLSTITISHRTGYRTPVVHFRPSRAATENCAEMFFYFAWCKTPSLRTIHIGRDNVFSPEDHKRRTDPANRPPDHDTRVEHFHGHLQAQAVRR